MKAAFMTGFPGWKITKKIGAGNYGTVYEICRDDDPEAKCALKVIRIPQDPDEIEISRGEGMDDQTITSYYKSVKASVTEEFATMEKLAGLTNIVGIQDRKEIPHEDGIGWDILIRMELLTPLTRYTQEHPLSEADVVRVGTDICRALAACEKEKIIHRDIKPANIFVDRFGNFKLGDFGIARSMEKTLSTMSSKGTYGYMAPEIYHGERYGQTIDLYSLGLVLYRYLNNGREPFLPPAPQTVTAQNRSEALNRRMRGEAIPAPANGNAELKRTVLKAIAYDPSQRWQTADDFMEALQGKVIQESNEKSGQHFSNSERLVSVQNDFSDNAGGDLSWNQTYGTFGRKDQTSCHNEERKNIEERTISVNARSPEMIQKSVSGGNALTRYLRNTWWMLLLIGMGGIYVAVNITTFPIIRIDDFCINCMITLGWTLAIHNGILDFSSGGIFIFGCWLARLVDSLGFLISLSFTLAICSMIGILIGVLVLHTRIPAFVLTLVIQIALFLWCCVDLYWGDLYAHDGMVNNGLWGPDLQLVIPTLVTPALVIAVYLMFRKGYGVLTGCIISSILYGFAGYSFMLMFCTSSPMSFWLDFLYRVPYRSHYSVILFGLLKQLYGIVPALMVGFGIKHKNGSLGEALTATVLFWVIDWVIDYFLVNHFEINVKYSVVFCLGMIIVVFTILRGKKSKRSADL